LIKYLAEGATMRSGIVINFDYENNDMAVVQGLFEEVKDGMFLSGFRLEDRLFTIELAADEACNLARLVVEYIESQQGANRNSIFMYIKDFYGIDMSHICFDMSHISNLMIPGRDGIEVQESEDLAFESYGLAV
jgi:hypothetical protein